MEETQTRLQAELTQTIFRAEQFESLATHRRQQLDDVHALLNEHNARLEADTFKLEQFQYKQRELEDYLNEQMADRDGVCLSVSDVERLQQLWGENSNTHPH